MRPTKLVMEGFGAYRDRTEVDFEGVDLFAFTGPTGAGKSTIVDAICMALYGSIPRYDDQRLIAPSISQGLNEALVHLEFTVEGVPYTAVRVIKRTKTGATTREARLESGGTVLAGNEKELTQKVTELLGLTFEHFTRCVVLPQGQFAKFLHDKPKDRQELLKKLLDITVYEAVASAARTRATRAKARALAAEERLGDLASVTPERRAELAEQATARRELHASVRGQEAGLASSMADLERLRTEAQAASAAAVTLAALSVPATVRELATRAERTVEALGEAVAEAGAQEGEVAGAETTRRALGDTAPLVEARQAHEQLADLADATPARRSALAARRAQLDSRYLELRAEEDAIAGLAADAAAAQASEAAARAAAARLGAVTVPADALDLSDRVAAGAGRVAARELVVASADLDVAAAEAVVADAGDAGALRVGLRAFADRAGEQERWQRLHEEVCRAEAALATARQEAAEATDAHRCARRVLDEATVRHQAHALRPHLVSGAPCPVCEQLVTALPPSELPIEFTDACSAEEAARHRAERAAVATAGAAATVRAAEAAESESVQRLAGLDREVAGFGTVQEVEARLAAIADAIQALEHARSVRARAEADVATDRRDHEQLVAAERVARQTFLAVHMEVAMWSPPAPSGSDLRADWASLADWAVAESTARAAMAEELRCDVESVGRAVAGRRAVVERVCTEADVRPAPGQSASEAVFATAAATGTELGQLELRIATRARLEQSLDAFARSHPLADSSLAAITERLEAIAVASAHVDTARLAHASATKRVEGLRAEQADLQQAEARERQHVLHASNAVSALGAPVPTGAVLADWEALVAWAEPEAATRSAEAASRTAHAGELEAEISNRRAALVDRLAAAGISAAPGQTLTEAAATGAQTAEHAAQQMDVALASIASLQVTLRAAKREEAVAHELAQLLRADQFEKWLLDDVMVQLVEGATERLMDLSGQQFALGYEDGDFLIVDHRNADQTRPAKTLSGGETFLASLSLALSLADQLATFATGKSVRLDALFLDEGFGTLDADTLDVVASAIEELGSRGRMVGLISHVPELAERVPVRFEVRKIANASHIEKVWQ